MRRLSASLCASCCHLTLCSSSLNAIKTTFTSNCHADRATNTLFFSAPQHTSYSRQHIILVSVLAERGFFGLPVWSHCKYFQYSITAPKSLQSLPGEKQNSHLRFSCRAFFRQILLLPDLHPPLAPEELTFQTLLFSHKVPSPPLGFKNWR